MEAEAESLFLFARHKKLALAEKLPEITAPETPCAAGSEHKVFKTGAGKNSRVIKVTHSSKFGRKEHTPQLYLRRWALLNEMAPAVKAKFEDCVRNADGGLAIIVSMALFKGPHPTPEETDSFIKNRLGFRPFSDGSTTLDYISPDGRLILRDCHPRNWIKTKGTLIPIDIIPELTQTP